MRISDWSSDVCSSDLDLVEIAAPPEAFHFVRFDDQQRYALRARRLGVGLGNHDNDTGILSVADEGLLAVDDIAIVGAPRRGAHRLEVRPGAGLGHRNRADQFARRHARQPAMALRSEEHTSELQSLMRK